MHFLSFKSFALTTVLVALTVDASYVSTNAHKKCHTEYDTVTSYEKQCSTTYEQECNTVQEQQCKPKVEEVCNTVDVQECSVSHESVCSQHEEKQCSVKHEEKCSTVYEEETVERTRDHHFYNCSDWSERYMSLIPA